MSHVGQLVAESLTLTRDGPNNGDLGEAQGPSQYPPSGVVAHSASGSERSSNSAGEHVGMARIAEADAVAFNILAKEVEEMGRVFFNYFTGEDAIVTRRYLSDVFVYRDASILPEILGILRRYGESRRSGMFGYSVEDKHVHIIHDCTFGGSWCRDIFRKQIEPFGHFKSARKQNKPVWQFTRIDFYDVFIYFFLRKRGDRKIWARGESWEAPTDGK